MKKIFLLILGSCCCVFGAEQKSSVTPPQEIPAPAPNRPEITLLDALKEDKKFDEIQNIIDTYSSINESDSFGRTPLMMAVALKREDVVSALIKAGADVNAQDVYKNSPILIATSSENPKDEIIATLLEAGADIFALDIDNKNALDYAILNPTLSSKSLRLVKIQPKINFLTMIEKATPEQISQALHFGARADDLGMMGVTPLMMAAAKNPNTLVIDLLLGSGARINQQDPIGQTALFYAVKQNKNPEIIKVLLQRGAFTDIKDNGGKTAADYAKKRSDLSPELKKALKGE